MSTLSNGPQQSVTVQDVDAWLLAAHERRAQLHLHAARPCQSAECYEALLAMSALLLEAFEAVRVVSESMREWNQATREEAVDLRIHSAQCAKTIVRAAQFARPLPEALRVAESQMLAMFRDGPQQQPR